MPCDLIPKLVRAHTYPPSPPTAIAVPLAMAIPVPDPWSKDALGICGLRRTCFALSELAGAAPPELYERIELLMDAISDDHFRTASRYYKKGTSAGAKLADEVRALSSLESSAEQLISNY